MALDAILQPFVSFADAPAAPVALACGLFPPGMTKIKPSNLMRRSIKT